MEKEHSSQITQKLDQSIQYFNTISNYIIKPEINKIHNYKAITSNNSFQILLNKTKIKNINNKHNFNSQKEKINKSNELNKRKTIKLKNNIICKRKSNDKKNSQKNLINSEIQKFDNIDINVIKSYRSSILKRKGKLYKNKKSILKGINNYQSKENINKNNHISTNVLFKSNHNSRELKNKFFKKNNKLNIFTDSIKIEDIYKGNNNFLNINGQTLSKDKNNKINKNLNNTLTISHKNYKIDNINNIKNKIGNYNNEANNRNVFYLNHKYLCNSLNKSYLTNYFNNNNKTTDINSSTTNFEKKLYIKPFRDLIKTEKDLELDEIKKNIYQLINKKKKIIYLDNKVSISLNNIKSSKLKNNPKLDIDNNNLIYPKINNNLEKITDDKIIVGINEYKLSPIKQMVKKNTEEQLYLINDFKNKKKLNNEKNSIKTKQNLSLIENKYVCQKNNTKSEKKNK